jgi:hypothetical protein
VAAYNTSFILGYLLLDLFFFPSPRSKSAYPSTSKLKVPVDNHSPLRPQQQQAGNPPALLEAFNKNGLALFLLVRCFVQTFFFSLIMVSYNFEGECRYGTCQLDDSDDVYARFLGDDRVEFVWIWCVRCRVGIER